MEWHLGGRDMRRVLAAAVAFTSCALSCSTIVAAEPSSGNRSAAAEDRRIALVIGNGKYTTGPLDNAVNDARAIAKALALYGFNVVERYDANQEAMRRAIREFGDAIKNGGVGLFYFAGHGVQVNGRN